ASFAERVFLFLSEAEPAPGRTVFSDGNCWLLRAFGGFRSRCFLVPITVGGFLDGKNGRGLRQGLPLGQATWVAWCNPISVPLLMGWIGSEGGALPLESIFPICQMTTTSAR